MSDYDFEHKDEYIVLDYLSKGGVKLIEIGNILFSGAVSVEVNTDTQKDEIHLYRNVLSEDYEDGQLKPFLGRSRVVKVFGSIDSDDCGLALRGGGTITIEKIRQLQTNHFGSQTNIKFRDRNPNKDTFHWTIPGNGPLEDSIDDELNELACALAEAEYISPFS